jgi:hypothetical protein
VNDKPIYYGPLGEGPDTRIYSTGLQVVGVSTRILELSHGGLPDKE